MKYLIPTVLLLLITSCASNKSIKKTFIKREIANTHEIYQGSFSKSNSLTTDYIKTTGISGNLFGHISDTDYNQLIKDYQVKFIRQLEQEGYDPTKVVMLPLDVERFDVSIIDSMDTTSEGLFGGEKTDNFKKYRADFKFNFNFLYLGENPPQNLSKVESNKIKITINRNGYEKVAEINGDSKNIESLLAITKESSAENVGELKASDVNLSERQKIDLRNKVKIFLREKGYKLKEQKLSLHVDIPVAGSQNIQVLAASSDNESSKLLQTIYLKGAASKLKGSCSDLILRILNK